MLLTPGACADSEIPLESVSAPPANAVGELAPSAPAEEPAPRLDVTPAVEGAAPRSASPFDADILFRGT